MVGDGERLAEVAAHLRPSGTGFAIDGNAADGEPRPDISQ